MPKRIPINYLKIFKRGTLANYNGMPYVVDHITLRGYQLFVHLEGLKTGVPAEHVSVEVTEIDFNRIQPKQEE